MICRPELKKYIFCGIITALHASAFMYLPHVYGDIDELMKMKISAISSE
jgi:hypothetical protein